MDFHTAWVSKKLMVWNEKVFTERNQILNFHMIFFFFFRWVKLAYNCSSEKKLNFVIVLILAKLMMILLNKRNSFDLVNNLILFSFFSFFFLFFRFRQIKWFRSVSRWVLPWQSTVPCFLVKFFFFTVSHTLLYLNC